MSCGGKLRRVVVLSAFFLAMVSWQAVAQTEKAETGEVLRSRANEAMPLGTSVEGIGRMKDLFEYAEYLHENGNDEQAAVYLEEALCRKPWDFEHQLLYARMLLDAGNAVEGERRARFVARLAEDGETVAAARRILGAEAPPSKIPQQTVPPDGPVVVLVPLGKVEAWLLLDTAEVLKECLGISVVVADLGVGVPAPKRDGYEAYLADLRKRLLSSVNDPNLTEELKRQRLSFADLEEDSALDPFIRQFLKNAGAREQYIQVCKMLDELKVNGRQWESLELLQEMKIAVSSLPQRKGLAFLGVTGLDIFSGDSNFLYAQNLGNCSVLSYYRYRAAQTGEPPNRERLFRRFRVLCLSSVGHLLEVEPCSYPTCPHSFQMTLPEHDAKEEEYCPTCRKAMEKALGHSLSTASGLPK